MKLKLEFDLPTEEYEAQSALQGQKLRLVVSDFLAAMREKLKYGQLSDEAVVEIEDFREMFYKMAKEDKVEID
jgi:hypothetical protein